MAGLQNAAYLAASEALKSDGGRFPCSNRGIVVDGCFTLILKANYLLRVSRSCSSSINDAGRGTARVHPLGGAFFRHWRARKPHHRWATSDSTDQDRRSPPGATLAPPQGISAPGSLTPLSRLGGPRRALTDTVIGLDQAGSQHCSSIPADWHSRSRWRYPAQQRHNSGSAAAMTTIPGSAIASGERDRAHRLHSAGSSQRRLQLDWPRTGPRCTASTAAPGQHPHGA